MKKLSILVLSTVVGAASLATLPAMAAATAMPTSAGVISCPSGSFDEFRQNPDLVAGMLKSDGVSFSSLSEWNGCIKATSTDAKGNAVIAFYDPNSLALVATVG